MQTNEQRQFWSQKNPEQEWQTLKVSHPDYMDAVRIVANTFREQMFGGEVYLPAPMQLKEPENGEDLKNTASATFPRAVIGDAVTRLWRQVSDSGRLKPFSATICTWRDSDRNAHHVGGTGRRLGGPAHQPGDASASVVMTTEFRDMPINPSMLIAILEVIYALYKIHYIRSEMIRAR